MQKLIIFFSCLVFLTSISIAQEAETKEPLSQEARMAWFRDAKFGMFIQAKPIIMSGYS